MATFAAALRQRLAVFQRNRPGDILGPFAQRLDNLQDKRAALLAGELAPLAPRLCGVAQGPRDDISPNGPTRAKTSPVAGFTTSSASRGSTH